MFVWYFTEKYVLRKIVPVIKNAPLKEFKIVIKPLPTEPNILVPIQTITGIFEALSEKKLERMCLVMDSF